MSGLHVSGLLVRTRPDEVDRVRSALETLPGVSVEAVLTEGRLVTLAEQATDAELADVFRAVQDTPGVLSASLVYHYSDPNGVPHEEID